MEPTPTVLNRVRQRLTLLLGQLGEAASEVKRLEAEKKARQDAIRQKHDKQRDEELAEVSAAYDPAIVQATKQRDSAKDKLLELVPMHLRWFYKPHTTTAHFDTGEIQYTKGKPSLVVDDEAVLRADLKKRRKYLEFTKDVKRPLDNGALKSALLDGVHALRNLRGAHLAYTPEYIFRPGKTVPSSTISVEAPDPQED